jgi:hypothetical protein
MKPDRSKRNLYKVTDRDLDSPGPSEELDRPVGLQINAVINGFVSFVGAAAAESTLSGYRDMFDKIGLDLSSATRFILGSSPLWWLFAIAGIALAAWVIVNPVVRPDKLRKMKLAVRGFTVLLGVFIAFTIYAVFVPLMRLGSAV